MTSWADETVVEASAEVDDVLLVDVVVVVVAVDDWLVPVPLAEVPAQPAMATASATTIHGEILDMKTPFIV